MTANEALRAARRALPSPYQPGQPASRSELAELVAAEVYRQTGREAPIDGHYVAKLERGVIRWPSAAYRAALRAVLGAGSDHELGLRPPRRAEASSPGSPGEDGLLELAAHAETSEVGIAGIEALEETVELACRRYTTTEPNRLLAEVRHRAREVSALLDRRTTLSQRRRLLVVGGWLALLAATLHVDTGNRAGAAAARATATSLGRETGHRELAAWSVEIAAWAALADHDWPRAARLAAEGLDLAPKSSSAAVQLSAQHARALARLGDAGMVRAALDTAAAGIDNQSGARPADHHFHFDGRKLDYYVATTLAWLGDPAGEAAAREVADRYRHGPPRRLVTARIDLGLILARNERPDEAAHLGLLATDSGWLMPSNAWRIHELDTALATRRDVPEVAELHDRIRTDQAT